MYQIQATVAMEQQQVISELQQQEFVLDEKQRYVYSSGPHTRTYQKLRPGQRRECQKVVEEGPSIQKISQEFHRSTAYEYPTRHAPTQSIFRIFMQGPLEDDFNGIPTRSSHKDRDHARTSQRFIRISTRDSRKGLTKIFMPGPLRDSHKIIMKGPAAAGKDLTRSRASQEHPTN